MINYEIAKNYCCEDISRIENFEIAATDTSEVWHIHHRKETDENIARKTLIENNMYYNRPAAELIFLTKAMHNSTHFKNRKLSDEVRRHMSEGGKGKKLSDEHKRHISEATSGDKNGMYGKHHSNESKAKISQVRKKRIASGEIVIAKVNMTDEVKTKLSDKAKERYKDKTKHPMYGRKHSEETRKKISEAKKGRAPWNKGLRKAGN